ncbi:MAG: hypothetical protein M1290_05020 [Candidatus Thermoplasmatota archaeon]|jgi:hypothetical protein|nr:hypothetical protein [Candidatus Thermoplasmatota archaeon]MCL5789806.1 hypothetical protein [Candidatus Thermoplasmatota archaeon]
MTKILFLLVAGKDFPERANLALMMVSRQIKAKRYEDVKVLLYGPSEEFVAELQGDAKEAFNEIVKAGALDSACSFIAKKYDIELKLQSMNVTLLPFGERLARYVNEGYEVITF